MPPCARAVPPGAGALLAEHAARRAQGISEVDGEEGLSYGEEDGEEDDFGEEDGEGGDEEQSAKRQRR